MKLRAVWAFLVVAGVLAIVSAGSLNADLARFVRPTNATVIVHMVGPAAVCGDLTGDGFVDTLDAITSLQIMVGRRIPTDEQRIVGDVVADGMLNILDSVAILQLILNDGQLDFECRVSG